MTTASWTRLIRFVNNGKVYLGEPILGGETDIAALIAAGKKVEAKVIDGDAFEGTVTDQTLSVDELLGPLTPQDVPLVKCVGLNYMKHIKEGGRTPPPYPLIFYKPNFCVSDHGKPVPIPKLAQGKVDYEGELCVVIGKTGKDIREEDALDYVLGYTAGNDVSERTWQRDPAYAGGVPQWCFSKSFDKYAPLGPQLVSPRVISDPSKLHLKTLVNDEVRQDTPTDDLLFNIPRIISFISQGTTLEKGTVIMTGTPSGVAMGMKEPKWLQNGDVVKVHVSEIGTLTNEMAFE